MVDICPRKNMSLEHSRKIASRIHLAGTVREQTKNCVPKEVQEVSQLTYRAAFVLAIVLVLLMTVPASAQVTQLQNTFKLGYWGTGLTFRDATVTPRDPGSAWTLAYRGDVARQPWSVSINYESANITPIFREWNRATMWELNGHYRLGVTRDTSYGVFLGVGSVSVSSILDPTENGSGSGIRLGAEFFSRLQRQFTLFADLAVGLSWSSNFPAEPGTPSGSTFQYRIGVQAELQDGLGVELGWKGFTWTIPAGGFCPLAGCRWDFSGVTLAITLRR